MTFRTILTFWAILTITSLNAIGSLTAILPITISRARTALLPITAVEALSVVLTPGKPLLAFAAVTACITLAPVLASAVTPIIAEPLVALAEVSAAIPVFPVPATALAVARSTLVAVALVPALALRPVFARLSRVVHARLRLIGAHSHLRLVAAGLISVLTGVTIVRLARNLELAMAGQSAADPFPAALLDLLVAEGQDDTIVVLSVLQIVLRKHVIARRQRIARQRHVFLGDLGRGTVDLLVGTIRLVGPHQGIVVILPLPVLRLVAATSATAVLLSLPHGTLFSRAMCLQTFAKTFCTSNAIIS